MKEAWSRARQAYEHVEGALAPIFPAGDTDLFDDQGVTGLHGIERILWSDAIPATVVTFEKSLPGYKVAASPATEQEVAAAAACSSSQDDNDIPAACLTIPDASAGEPAPTAATASSPLARSS